MLTPGLRPGVRADRQGTCQYKRVATPPTLDLGSPAPRSNREEKPGDSATFSAKQTGLRIKVRFKRLDLRFLEIGGVVLTMKVPDNIITAPPRKLTPGLRPGVRADRQGTCQYKRVATPPTLDLGSPAPRSNREEKPGTKIRIRTGQCEFSAHSRVHAGTVFNWSNNWFYTCWGAFFGKSEERVRLSHEALMRHHEALMSHS
eukprot:sb/3470613/